MLALRNLGPAGNEDLPDPEKGLELWRRVWNSGEGVSDPERRAVHGALLFRPTCADTQAANAGPG